MDIDREEVKLYSKYLKAIEAIENNKLNSAQVILEQIKYNEYTFILPQVKLQELEIEKTQDFSLVRKTFKDFKIDYFKNYPDVATKNIRYMSKVRYINEYIHNANYAIKNIPGTEKSFLYDGLYRAYAYKKRKPKNIKKQITLEAIFSTANNEIFEYFYKIYSGKGLTKKQNFSLASLIFVLVVILSAIGRSTNVNVNNKKYVPPSKIPPSYTYYNLENLPQISSTAITIIKTNFDLKRAKFEEIVKIMIENNLQNLNKENCIYYSISCVTLTIIGIENVFYEDTQVIFLSELSINSPYKEQFVYSVGEFGDPNLNCSALKNLSDIDIKGYCYIKIDANWTIVLEK